MHYRLLGNTGISVSEVGFGTIPIMQGPVPILPRYFNLTTAQSEDLMSRALDHGCNFFDTAMMPEYGDSESKLGSFARKYRDRMIVSSKARAYTETSMHLAVEASLKNLRLDACDLYFVHQAAPENALDVFDTSAGAIVELVKQKRTGNIRAVGVATHHYNIALRSAMDPRVDVIQVPGNVLERGILDRIEACPSFSKIGIVVHKALAAGVLTDHYSVSHLIRFPLTYTKVSSVLIGLGTTGQVTAAFRYGKLKGTQSFDQVVRHLSKSLPIVACDRCQECECPMGIDIPNVVRYLNYFFLGHHRWARNRLGAMLDSLMRCDYCPLCAAKCPRQLDIRSIIHGACSLMQGGSKSMVSNKDGLKRGKDFIGVGVGGVIISNNRILLLLRNKSPEKGYWTLPGGTVEFGETVEEALLREIQEELGVEGQIQAPLGVTNHILSNEGVHWVSPRFLVEIISGTPRNVEPESHSDLAWFEVGDLPENITVTTQKAVAAYQTWLSNWRSAERD